MSRFASLDLSTLPKPTAITDLDYAGILDARLEQLESKLSDVFDDTQKQEIMGLATNIAASPMRYLNEAAAARELYLQNKINEAVRSIFLATARGADLDQIGANRGVTRGVIDDSDPDNIIKEDDETFRARIQLVIESYSPHGTEGSYIYWALNADDRITDAIVYGPNDTPQIATDDGAENDPNYNTNFLPAEPRLVILSSAVANLEEANLEERDIELQNIVFENCTQDKRRPIGDKLTVVHAKLMQYKIEATLYTKSSDESHEFIKNQAQNAAQTFVNERRRIGRPIYRESVAAALNVGGVSDLEIKLILDDSNDTMDTAEVIEPNLFEAPHCTEISIAIASQTGTWRDG